MTLDELEAEVAARPHRVIPPKRQTKGSPTIYDRLKQAVVECGIDLRQPVDTEALAVICGSTPKYIAYLVFLLRREQGVTVQRKGTPRPGRARS